MVKEMHTQCLLEKPLPEGGAVTVTAWIESRFARVGAPLRMKHRDGTWEGVWTVRQTFSTIPSEEARQRSWDWTHQRDASDI